MHYPTIASICLLTLGSAAAAQNLAVFPSDHTNAEGYSSQGTFPFSAGISRQQAIYHRRDLTIPNGSRIDRLGVRPNAASASNGQRIQLEVLMGQTARDPRPGAGNPVSSTFASNYGGAPTTVFARRVVDLPAVVASTQQPSPTNVTITLDTPFTYDNTQNLVADWFVFANSNANQAFAYTMDYASFLSPVAEFGTACQSSGNTTPRCTFAPAYIGGGCTVYLNGSAASSASSLMIGMNALPAPIPLDALGMPGCSLHIDPLVYVNTVTGGSGTTSTTFTVPDQLSNLRRSIVAQHVTADVFANSLGLITSTAARVTFGAYPLMTTVSVVGNITATTGSLAQNNGAVSVFGWQ